MLKNKIGDLEELSSLLYCKFPRIGDGDALTVVSSMIVGKHSEHCLCNRAK
jgi:hypothetical protein